MTDLFRERHLRETMRVLDREQSVWVGICILLFAVGFLLSGRIDPIYLAPSVIIMALVISRDIHSTFPLGNMEMVLMLSKDMGRTSDAYIGSCLKRLVPYTVLSAATLSLGIIARIGLHDAGTEAAMMVGYTVVAGVLMAAVRWDAAVRFGRKVAISCMVWINLLILAPFALLAFFDWDLCLAGSAGVVLLLAAMLTGIRMSAVPSKSGMIGGV